MVISKVLLAYNILQSTILKGECYSECDRLDRARLISLKYTTIYLHIKILLCGHVGIKCS